MVEVFKTNVPGSGCQAKQIVSGLVLLLPGCKINFDLQDPDRILRIEGEIIRLQIIIEHLHGHGYACSVLE